jgi:hypothetical protein
MLRQSHENGEEDFPYIVEQFKKKEEGVYRVVCTVGAVY